MRYAGAGAKVGRELIIALTLYYLVLADRTVIDGENKLVLEQGSLSRCGGRTR